MANTTMYPGPCDLPPPGWRCTRGKGHEGPCAAVQEYDFHCKDKRRGVANLLESIAEEGLPEPRDLDTALDHLYQYLDLTPEFEHKPVEISFWATGTIMAVGVLVWEIGKELARSAGVM